MGNEASASKLYGSISNEEMISIIKNQMSPEVTFIDESIPTLHTKPASKNNEGLNLIIIVEESLGAQFVGSLGGKPLTPSIDSFKDKSWFFKNLYATGTRSARGLEAITTGFLPSPARSVLKLPKAQSNFYTIAETLEDNGYLNTFVYGGESHFDNMKGFFLSNGFHQAVDQSDYKNPQFVGNWGVSDEDLFNKAIHLLDSANKQPQFMLVFSSSNHTPFEFPDNKIELYDQEKATVNNAVKYADYALGQFLNNLDQKGYFENSIVMVVADHDARVMGDDLVPVNRFHIPGFIVGKGVENKIDESLVSQIDLAPTLLSLLGIDSPTPMIGRDLTQVDSNYKGRAIMQYANNQAYLTQESIVILQPDKKAVQYQIKDGQPDTTRSLSPDNTALAHAQFASWSYNNEKYKLAE
ncbi:MAG: LTA synthase family protein [Marinicella sp.]